MLTGVGWIRLRQNSGEVESRVAAHPGQRERLLIDVVRTPGAPIQVDVSAATFSAVLQDVPEHRLERREAGAAGNHEEGAGAAAVDELADGAFDSKQGAVGEGIAGRLYAGRSK